MREKHDLLKTDEAAEFLRTTTGTLANLRCEGTGPPYLKIGRRILYEASELEAWLRQYRIKTADHPHPSID